MQLQTESQIHLTGHLLLLLAGLAALGSFATNIILPAFPNMAEELGTSVKDLSSTLASFFVAFAVGQLFVGPLSDRFGRKWLVVSGLIVFVTGSVLCGVLSPNRRKFQTPIRYRYCKVLIYIFGLCAKSGGIGSGRILVPILVPGWKDFSPCGINSTEVAT